MPGIIDTKTIKNVFCKVPTYITATNLLIIFIIITVIYLCYKWWITCGTETEGFTENIKALTDLLDKQKVNLYELAPLWDNILYSSQPQRKERPISFWKPSKEAGELYKEIGHCVSDSAEYNSPVKTTMLVKGDTKPPVESKLITSLPDNIITASMYDTKGNKIPSIYTGIKTSKDIDERIEELKSHLEDVQSDYDNVKTELTNKLIQLEEKSLTHTVEVCNKETYFVNPARSFNIKPGETVNITPGQYSTLRIPFGSKATLTSSTGRTIEFEIPYEALLNESGSDIANDGKGPSYYAVVKSVRGDTFSVDDFNIIGRYGLRARDLNADVNNADNSTEARDYSQTDSQVYMPYTKDYEYGLFNAKVAVRSSFNYAVGSKNSHDLYGRNNLYTYFNNKLQNPALPTGNQDDVVDVNVSSNIINFSTKHPVYSQRKRDDAADLGGASPSKLYNPMITNNSSRLTVNYSFMSNFINKIKAKQQSAQSWYISDMSLLNNSDLQTILTNGSFKVDTYYVDLAFMLTTYIRKLRMTDTPGFESYAVDVNGSQSDCCEISKGAITEESLSRNAKFQGYLTSGSITLQSRPEQYVKYIETKKKLETVSEIADKIINNVNKMINMLENLKQDISQNKLTHFPMKIYRPVAPDNYTNLGDVIFTNDDANYHKRSPILDNIACVPSQCTREIREWLPVDKIWEYSQGDIYIGIYKNPYLQTFRATTVPGVLPPGKVVKVVACVEKCKLLDDIIEADKCAKTFYNANKSIIEGNNLDKDKQILERESSLYKNEISSREDRLNTMRELARRLQIQDAKADIINKEHNRQKLQSLVDTQRVNMNKLVDKLEDGKHSVDINIKFDYDKFAGLITRLKPKLPGPIYNKIMMAINNSAKRKLDAIPEETVSDILGYCPSPETQGLVVKALVESGCYNCSNLN